MVNTSVITDRPIVYSGPGKLQRLAAGGTIEVGKINAVDDLTLNPGLGKSIYATVKDGYLSLEGYSNSSYQGINGYLGLVLKDSTPATGGSLHKNPPVISSVGQYFIGGQSVYRSLGKFGMLATTVDGSNEITEYSLAWANNSNSIKWRVTDLGETHQSGDINLNPTYTAAIKSVKSIVGAGGLPLTLGYTGLNKINIEATSVSLLSDTGNSYVQVADTGNVLVRSDSTHNVILSNEAVTPGSYGAMILDWKVPTKATEFDGMSFSLYSSDANGAKAPKMSMLNEMVYGAATYNPAGGDVSIQTNIRATSLLNTVTALGGNVQLKTSIARGNLPLADAGRILFESGNTGKGLLDYSLQALASGSIRLFLGAENTSSITTSSVLVVKKSATLGTSGIKMMALQGNGPSDYAEVILASNLTTSTPAATGSLALDTNGGKLWVRQVSGWKELATSTTFTTSELIQVPIAFDLITPPVEGDVVVLSAPIGGIEYVTPAIANVSLSRVVGIASATSDYVQTEGVASVKSSISILAGEEVYLSDVDIGEITNIVPSTPGSSVAPIGVAVKDAVAGFCDILLDIKEPMYIP